MPLRIEDYALLGNCETAALVGRDGSIDWLCLPRFDSPACFAALLGTPEHGRWRLAPAAAIRAVQRRYRDDTLVLETEYETDTGAVRVVDCMPPRTERPELVRLVEGTRGRVAMRMELAVRFDYGSLIPWVRRVEDGLSAVGGPDGLRRRTPVDLRGENFENTNRARRRTWRIDAYCSRSACGSARSAAGSATWGLRERHRAHRGQALRDRVPGGAGIVGQEHVSVLGAEDDRAPVNSETAGVDVVGEPLGEPGPAALESRVAFEAAPVDGGPATVVAVRGAEKHRVAGQDDRATVVRVEPLVLPPPCVATIRAHAEAIESGDEHEPGMGRWREHLMDIVLDVEHRAPGGAGVGRPQDAAHVHVHVDAAVRSRADRAHVGRGALGRVPRRAAFRRVEGGGGRLPISLEAQEMGARGSD